MLKQYYLKYKEMINYIIVGIMTTIVSFVSFYICVETIFDPQNPILLQYANVISWICAVTFAYFANRKFVFYSNNNKLVEISKFYGARISTLLIEMLCMFFMVTILGLNEKLAKIIVQFVTLISNYLFSKFFVFIKK